MRVALLLRPDADVRSGGDIVQARAVARYLQQRGCAVTQLLGWRPPLHGYDLALVLNLTVPEQAWLHAAACRQAGLPYLVLPVFWDLASAIPGEQRPTGSALLPVGSRRRAAAQRARLASRMPGQVLGAAAARLPHYLGAHDRRLCLDVVEHARAVCPNSTAELEHLASWLGVSPDARWRVAHNGLWADDLPSLGEAVQAVREDVVLSVGAVSPRKNTLGLVRAARLLDIPFVVVGRAPRRTDAYARTVLAEAPPHVEFVDALPREDVLRRMMHARVHVQPGFVETPGLASLEALALATPVVVSDTAPVREYFGSDATYADPHVTDTLAEAIAGALDQGPQPAAAARVRRDYDWPVALAPLADVLGL